MCFINTYVVYFTAYISQEQAKDDTPSSLWIIGAVVGSVVFVVIVVWAVVCIIYCKYKRSPAAKALDQEGEPPLLRMSSPAGEGEVSITIHHFSLLSYF